MTTPANTPARAYTADELTTLRGTGTAVFSARINQAVFTLPIDELTYDTPTGDYTDITAGMVVWIGTSAGASDIGICHTRTDADASKIYLNPSSLEFADNLYVTVYPRPRQSARLGLAIQQPATVYTARVNGTPANLDGVAQITYDGGSGTLTDVREGQTLLIGSAAGLSDIATLRVRALPTSTVFYINQVSDAQIADDQYITVLDEFHLWQKDFVNDNGTIFVDYDIPYSAYNAGVCIPRVGPLMAIVYTTANTVVFTPPDPTQSACYDGATISDYYFECANATVTNATSPTDVYFTFNTDGNPHLYRWSVTITDSNGKSYTAYRWIYIDPPAVDFVLTRNPTGDYETGDWSFGVTVYNDATTADIRNGAMVTLYARDFYGAVEGSIGKLAGYENVLCTGWIDGESIQYDSETGSVSFTVNGANHWLSKLRAFPFELTNTTSTANTWNEIEDMTVDKALARILTYTTTAPLVMDLFFTGDTSVIEIIAQPPNTIMAQLEAIAYNTIWAKALTNNYGQMYIEVDSQIISSTDRAALPVVMDITTADYEAPLDLERVVNSPVSSVELSALTSYDGAVASPVYSRAPGVASPKTYGDIMSFENYIVADQDESNRICGALLANLNNIYLPVTINFTGNVRLFDIAPRMYATMTVSSADNPRGIAITAVRLIPRNVEMGHDPETGRANTAVTFEFEAVGVNGVTYTPPTPLLENEDITPPDIGSVDIPGLDDYFPPYVPGDVLSCPNGVFTVNSFSAPWSKSTIYGTDADPTAKVYFPCTLHPSFPSGTTSSVTMSLTFGGDADYSMVTLYAFKGGSRVATGSGSGAERTFSLVSTLDIDGFEIELSAGAGASLSFTAGSVFASGSTPVTSQYGATISGFTIGNYYAVSNTLGPWSGNADTRWEGVMSDPANRLTNLQVGSGITNPGSLGISGYDINSTRGIVFFQAAVTAYSFGTFDPAPGDNTGTLGYVVRNATATGRSIGLGNLRIDNVCPS